VRKHIRLSLLFHTASDEKLGRAWERGYYTLSVLHTATPHSVDFSHKVCILPNRPSKIVLEGACLPDGTPYMDLQYDLRLSPQK